VSAWERDQSLLEFRLVSQQSADKIEAGLDEQAAFLDQLERSFARPAPFSRQVFRSLVERLTRRLPIIQAVEWAPRVSAVERASFEAARRGELSGFTIRERDPSGKMRLADARAQYYPVTYVEPVTDDDEVVGFDLASEAARRTAIETSLTSDGVIATAPIRLVQEPGAQSGMFIVRAQEGGVSGPGVIFVVLRMGDFLGALVDSVHAAINVQVIDSDLSAPLFDNIASEPGVAR
jgi:CHASE1-domain containing sensor protein